MVNIEEFQRGKEYDAVTPRPALSPRAAIATAYADYPRSR